MLGRTGDDTCPVKCMCEWFQASNVQPDEPLFKGMTYSTMLPTLRDLVPPEREPKLYGLHSFRVGGAQAMAIAGRSAEYIMARGRWKAIESVLRYVQTPLEERMRDAQLMAEPTARHLQAQAPSIWSNTPLNRNGVSY